MKEYAENEEKISELINTLKKLGNSEWRLVAYW